MANLILSALDIPFSYEDVIKASDNSARMMDFIVPVTGAEELITQVVHDIKRTGYLLFLYGVPGIGKSTFINSLKWRKHIRG